MVDIDRMEFLRTLEKFPSSARYQAKVLLDRLDPSLAPEITIVAIPLMADEMLILRSGSTTYDPDWFDVTRKSLSYINEIDMSSLAHDVRGMIWQIRVEIKQTVQALLDKRLKSSDVRAFTIFPVFMHNHCVFLILEISRSVLAKHYRLSNNAIRPYPKETSLVHEVVVAYLYKSLDPLEKVGQGRLTFYLDDSGRETLRRAGFWLMNTVEKACGEQSLDSLFRASNTISSLLYEGEATIGRIAVSRRNHPGIDTLVLLRDAVNLNQLRGIRKLLETTNDDISLLYDSSGIYGIGRINKQAYEPEKENLFEIRFCGSHSWTLMHDDHELMRVKYGLPGLPRSLIQFDEFMLLFVDRFPGISDFLAKRLWGVINRAVNQSHGTILVVSDHASIEAERLHNQSTRIEPMLLNEELTIPLSSIDGAILLEPDSTCHAIGVILDGHATENGDPSRGARYNSAVRYKGYAKSLGHVCLLVVVSEDGYLDLI